MKIENALEVVREAIHHYRPFKVVGYRNSSGDVGDYLVSYVGYQGYLNLVAQSVQALRNQTIKLDGSSSWPAALIAEATAEQMASWDQTLTKAAQAPPADKDPDPISIHEGDPMAFTVMHLRLHSRTVTIPGSVERPPRNSAIKTLIKEALRDQAPLSLYLGRMRFEEGKFQRIVIDDDTP